MPEPGVRKSWACSVFKNTGAGSVPVPQGLEERNASYKEGALDAAQVWGDRFSTPSGILFGSICMYKSLVTQSFLE